MTVGNGRGDIWHHLLGIPQERKQVKEELFGIGRTVLGDP